MNRKFSVLMSIYIKEKPEYVRECFESLLQQNVQADEWIIVEDGQLTEELNKLLDEYQNKYPYLIKRLPLEKNQGLGKALREGILHCTYDLVARVDTDDVSRKDRFEKQLKLFACNPQLDICGSHIKEFDNSVDCITAIRKVPLTDQEIKKYQKRRDAFNHMTVMFKKTSVINAGNYQHALLMEDSLLWVNMIMSGATCANIDDYLVYARTGKDFYKRRGGWEYYKKYRLGRKKIYETRYISWWDYEITLIVQFIVAVMPNMMRLFVFKKILRNNR